MKQTNLLKTFLLLCALVVGSNAWAADKWVKTAPADLQTGDIVVIVDQTSSKAMSNNNGSSAPSAVAVTLNAAKDEISSEVATTLQWTLTTSGSGDSKTFQFGSGDDYLTVSKSNNGVKVNDGARNTFTILTGGNNNGYYLYNNDDDDNRYVGCYNNSEWRCYGSINNNIKGNNNAFYKKTAASGPIDPSVTIPSTSLLKGSTTTISFPNDLTTISFESDNESVATVTAAGVVTGIAAGSAKITATWTAIDDLYNAGSQEFTVTVTEPTIYIKVTQAGQLVAGNEYILVATGYKRAMGAQGTNIRGYVDVTLNDNQIAITDEAVAVLTLGGSAGAWTFLASDNDEYLAYSGSSNQVHSNADGTADASKWIITEDFQLESANVEGRVLKYNAGSPRFACYANGQQSAVLFVKAGGKCESAVTAAGWATYVTPCDLEFAEGDAFVVSAATASTATLAPVTKIGANKAVLLKGEGTKTAIVLNEAPAAVANELAISTGGEIDGFVLAKKNGTVGFYKWNGGSLTSGKVYLPTPAGARDYLEFSFDETTAISATLNDKGEMTNDSYFNLAGQRVANPTKGLYIVNGRKVVVK